MLRPNLAYSGILLVAWVTLAYAALPVPPHQHNSWERPVARGVPEAVIDVSAILFEAGLADPRGGEFREIDIGTEGRSRLTRGWVFQNRYAVCWNGLVYPVQSVGPTADLEQDIRTITRFRSWSPFIDKGSPEEAFWGDLEHQDNRAPIAVALILRLGRGDLASQLWNVPNWSDEPNHDRDPLEWASAARSAWLATAYRRLLRERARGDDRAATATAESLLLWVSNWKVMLQKTGVIPWFVSSVDDFASLRYVPSLLADSQRRSREPRPVQRDWMALMKARRTPGYEAAVFFALPQPTRVAELIDRLEDVDVEKAIWPGNLELAAHPIGEILIQEGPAAVDPLIDAWERDQRLTRTVDRTRPWYPDARPISVKEVARAVLGEILQRSTVARYSSPAELRSWWRKNQPSGPLERSFAILAAADRLPEEWVESAEAITLRSDLRPSPGGLQMQPGACGPGKLAPPVAGEVLRGRKNPSVAELLARRVATVASSKQPALACRLAFLAYLWDPETALPLLRSVSPLESCRRDRLVISARIERGDLLAAFEWALFIRQEVTNFAFHPSELSPLWMFPENPFLSQLAESLFERPDSPLKMSGHRISADSPLLIVPAFRRAVLSSLRDHSVIGGASRSPAGGLSITLDAGTEDRASAPGTHEWQIRVMDIVAKDLSGIPGFPDFALDWPTGDKDSAVATIADFLLAHEEQIQAFPERLPDVACLVESVALRSRP